jgi:hypothetical protein
MESSNETYILGAIMFAALMQIAEILYQKYKK